MKMKESKKQTTPMLQVDDIFYHSGDVERAEKYAKLRNVKHKEVHVVFEVGFFISTEQRAKQFVEYVLDNDAEGEEFSDALHEGYSLKSLIRNRHEQHLRRLIELKYQNNWSDFDVCFKFGEYLAPQMDLKVCHVSEREQWAYNFYNKHKNSVPMNQPYTTPHDILNEIEDEYACYRLGITKAV